MQQHKAGDAAHTAKGHYHHLGLMAFLSFLAMYALMYAMVDSFSNVFSNVNQLYMAGLMTVPMVIIELLVMRSMYPDRRANMAILGASAVVLVAFWFFIRAQTGVSDRQFLKSMIPHHGGAILMCRENEFRDPEITKLCANILSSQQEEIDFMKAKLRDRGN